MLNGVEWGGHDSSVSLLNSLRTFIGLKSLKQIIMLSCPKSFGHCSSGSRGQKRIGFFSASPNLLEVLSVSKAIVLWPSNTINLDSIDIILPERCYVALNAPVPIRTLKLSSVEPVSTWMGDRRGTKLVLLALSWEVCISCNPVRLGGENYWSITWWSLCGHYGLLGGCISCNPGRMGGKKPYIRVSSRALT